MNHTIYKLTCESTGKGYVGYSSDVAFRWVQHQKIAENTDDERYLYNSIRKYGWENFTKEVLYESWDGEHCLNVMEPHFIAEHKTFWKDGGLNMTRGGEGVLGLERSPETIEKWRESMIAAGTPPGWNLPDWNEVEHPWIGRNHTEEAKEKNRQAHLGKRDHKKKWKLTFHDNSSIIIDDLKEYCKENEYSYGAVKQSHHKKRKYKGILWEKL